jgi:hypothetical protein
VCTLTFLISIRFSAFSVIFLLLLLFSAKSLNTEGGGCSALFWLSLVSFSISNLAIWDTSGLSFSPVEFTDIPVAESVRIIGVSSTTNGTLSESDEATDLATVSFTLVSFTGLASADSTAAFSDAGG